MYKVLIVDDEPMLRDLISKILEMKGHRSDQAPDGEEALKRIATQQYDAFIVDVVMPKMDGLTLLKKVRQMKIDLPVMIMTGFSRLSYMKQPVDEEAIRAGASDFISKPFSPSEFSARFHKMMATQEVLLQMKARQQEIERRSSEMIAAIQKESIERIEAIKKGYPEGSVPEDPPPEAGLPLGGPVPSGIPPGVPKKDPPSSSLREKTEQEALKLREYTHLVHNQIASHWNRPEIQRKEWANLEAEIAVIIRKDGRIHAVQVEKKSGNSNYDEASIATLRKAEPFPPFPAELQDEKIEISILFKKAR